MAACSWNKTIYLINLSSHVLRLRFSQKLLLLLLPLLVVFTFLVLDAIASAHHSARMEPESSFNSKRHNKRPGIRSIKDAQRLIDNAQITRQHCPFGVLDIILLPSNNLLTAGQLTSSPASWIACQIDRLLNDWQGRRERWRART